MKIHLIGPLINDYFIKELAMQLSRRGHQVRIYDFFQKKEIDYDAGTSNYLKVDNYFWNYFSNFLVFRAIIGDYFILKLIKSEFKSGDIVHFHYIKNKYNRFINQIVNGKLCNSINLLGI